MTLWENLQMQLKTTRLILSVTNCLNKVNKFLFVHKYENMGKFSIKKICKESLKRTEVLEKLETTLKR